MLPLQAPLGVQKQGMKVQKGKTRGLATSAPKGGKGKRAVVSGKSNDRRAGPSILSRKDNSRGKEKGGKRTVDLPRLSDLRITISNDKARYPADHSVHKASFKIHGSASPGSPDNANFVDIIQLV